MHIIFDNSDIQKMKEKHIVLELDVFRFPNNQIATAHCVVEKISLDTISQMENYIKLHDDLIKGYRNRQWKYCNDAIEYLMGSFGGDLDTFYTNLKTRVDGFIKEEPPKDWSYIIQK